MSAICGAIALDGRPLDPAILERMVRAQAFRGPDGSRSWVETGAALAHHALPTSARSRAELQPLCDPATGMVLVADARLDDRAELLRSLGTARPAGSPDAISDAALILAAYRKWGRDCARKLLGDFAFALWEPRERRLFCARDTIGVRQLHYAIEGKVLLFATTVAAVRAGMARPLELNQELLRDQVAGVYDRWIRETTYRSISRLPAAHLLLVENDKVRHEEYWTWAEIAPFPHGMGDAEAAARFRELLTQAIADRAESEDPLALMVSGGLDSTSVASLVHDTEFAGKQLPARIYSLGFQHTPSAEENEYLAAIHSKCARFPSQVLPADDLWALREFGADDGFVMDQPENEVIRALMVAPMRAATANGHRVMLTGHAGDQVLGGSAYYLSENFTDVRLRDALRELPHFARIRRRPAWRVLAQAYLRPLLPEDAGRWVRGGGTSAPLCEPAPRVARPPAMPWGSRSAAASGNVLRNGGYAAHLLYMDRLAGHMKLELRYPYLDRRVVDFVLSLPPRLRFRDGWSKYILRQGLKGTLPEKIRQRPGCAHFGELIDRGFRDGARQKLEHLLRDSRAVAMGVLTQERLERAAQQYRQDTRPSQFGALLGYCYVEAWLRAQEVVGNRAEEGARRSIGV